MGFFDWLFGPAPYNARREGNRLADKYESLKRLARDPRYLDRTGNPVYCTSACWGEHAGPCIYKPGTDNARRQDEIHQQMREW